MSADFADGDKFGICIYDYEVCWYVNVASTSTPELNFYWSDNSTTTIDETYPATTDLGRDIYDLEDFSYGFYSWFSGFYDEDNYAETYFYENLFYFQPADSDDKYEIDDELELWLVSSIDTTNVQSLVTLASASSLAVAVSAAALFATLS